MPISAPDFVHIHYETLDSTHLWCKQERAQIEKLLESFRYVIVSTSCQTRGQGRNARAWRSQPGNLAFNINLIDPINSMDTYHSLIDQLALASSVAVAHQMKKFGVPVQVKWPNDLVTSHGKIAGILVDRLFGPRGAWLCIGIGVNVLQPPQEMIDQPVDFMQRYANMPHLNLLLHDLAYSIYSALVQLNEKPLNIPAIFEHSPIRSGKRISLCLLKEGFEHKIEATVQCIDSRGCLQLIDQEGRIISVTSGQCSQVRTLDS